jgi:hypothetical protein
MEKQDANRVVRDGRLANRSNSREHHWWPVTLQKYWADRNGDVSWITPDGVVHQKRVKNRKIAYKSHGHTMLKGRGGWETNFEAEFATSDNSSQT